MTEVQQAIVDEALTWIGTPWHHMGRVKGAGVDCAMLLCEVYERVGVVGHVDPGQYPMDWHLHRSEERLLGWVEKYGTKVADGDPQPGDVLLYQYGRCKSHAAICIEWPTRMVHAYMLDGRVTENGVFDGELADRFAGAWRIAP